MGMAASQVRFLTLQDRKSTIGMRLGVLSNRKMALTRDMNKAAQAYNEAYSETKLQWYDSIDGKYTDISYAAMMTPNAGNAYTPFLLTDRNTGRVILDGQTYVGTICDPQHTANVGTNMVDGMERIIALGNYTPATYRAGLMTYDETTMAPIIIKDIMGITSFDKDKMIYEGVKNTQITDGGYQKLVHSDIMNKLNVAIGSSNLVNSTTVLVPNFEISKPSGTNKVVLCCATNLLSGDEYYCLTDADSNNARWCNTPGLSDNVQSTVSATIRAAMNTAGYIDTSGNVHSLTDETYWSTLYKNGAVVLSRYDVPTAHLDLRGTGTEGLSYSKSIDNFLGSSRIPNVANLQSQSDLYAWVEKFVTDVNKSGALMYDMSDYIVDIAAATTMQLRYSYTAAVQSDAIANSTPIIYNNVTNKPSELDFNAGDGVNVASLWENRTEFQTTVTGREGDPVGGTTVSGTENIALAIARQAANTASPILYKGSKGHFDNSHNYQSENINNGDCVMAISVKNMMDVALFYIEKCQQDLASGALSREENNISDIYGYDNDNTYKYFYNYVKDTFGYNEYLTGNGGSGENNYTDPMNYSQGELDYFIQGETSVPSARSILSNLDMLKEKLDHCYDIRNNAGYADANLSSIQYGQFDSLYSDLKGYLTSVIKHEGESINKSDLIGLANINEWICDALSQDYNDEAKVNQIKDDITSMIAARTVMKIDYDHDEDGTRDGFCGTHEVNNNAVSNWDTSQSAHPEAFAIDAGVEEGRRKQLFSQDSIDRKATKKLDIEGQLNALQLHQFKFYVNLVKECLARGWSNHNTSTTSLDNNSVSLHLQNGTWLINDTMAKSSSRVFEVANKEAREEALSKYEALQSELKVKEERIDIQMSKLETEQNAIKTELDSLKSIIKENIDSTFKIFNA